MYLNTYIFEYIYYKQLTESWNIWNIRFWRRLKDHIIYPSMVFFFSRLHLWHMNVPRLGVKSEPQLRPIPEPWQHWIWAASETYAAACRNTGSLTHWARPGIKPTSPQSHVQVLNPLNHNGKSSSTNFLNGDIFRIKYFLFCHWNPFQ